jgi:CHAD domain-containing protein
MQDITMKSPDIIQIKVIKNHINFIHDRLLMKDKLNKYVKSTDELDTFLYSNEPTLFGYQKRLKDDNDNVYLRKECNL